MFKFWSKYNNNDVVTETTPMLSNVSDVEKKSLRGGRLSRRWRVAREKIKKEIRAPKEFLKFSGSSVISVLECTLIIAVYLSVGVIAFSYVFENWRIVDSLYFRCVVLCTVWFFARYDLLAISKTVLLPLQLLVMEIFPPPHKQVVYFVPFMHLQGEQFYFSY